MTQPEEFINSLNPSVSRNLATEATFRSLKTNLFVGERSRHSRVGVYISRPLRTRFSEKEPDQQVRGIDAAGLSDATGKQSLSKSDTLPSYPGVENLLIDVDSAEQLKVYLDRSQKLKALFIRQRNSYAPLSISLELFQHLVIELKLPDRFTDYIIYLGERDTEVELAPPPATFRCVPGRATAHGQQHELMCGVRFVTLNSREDVSRPTEQWSLRQSGVYCRSSSISGELAWLFVTAAPEMQDRITNIWSSSLTSSGTNPWFVISAVYQIAVCNWRPYLVALTLEMNQQQANIMGTSLDDTGPAHISSDDRQELLILDNKIISTKLALQASKADLAFLMNAGIDLYDRREAENDDAATEFMSQMNNLLRDLDVNLLRLEQLSSRLSSTTNLLSTLLDLSSGYSLQNLTKETRLESANMRKLNEKMHDLAERNARDSATVTVLTILTLIYLPITVVSNFFSTSFVGTAASGNGIFVTGDWWILLASSLPLTLLTLYVWWIWSSIKASQTYPWWWPRSLQRHTDFVKDRTVDEFK